MPRETRSRIRFSEHEQDERFFPFFVRISSPWDPQQYVLIECPEHFNSDSGWILNHRRDIVLVHKMVRPIEWRFSPDGERAGYSYNFDDGMAFSLDLRADGSLVHLSAEFTNGSPTAMNLLEPCFCVRLDPIAEMTTPEDKMDHLRRTFALCAGRPLSFADIRTGVAEEHQRANPGRIWTGCVVRGERREPEYWWLSKAHAADCGLIATESPQGGRWVAFTWERNRVLFTNINCPCIHSQPTFPDCQPGRVVRNHGKILFHEGTFDELLEALDIEN